MFIDYWVNENSYIIIYWKYVSWLLVSLFMFKMVLFELVLVMIIVILLKCVWMMFKIINWYDVGV